MSLILNIVCVRIMRTMMIANIMSILNRSPYFSMRAPAPPNLKNISESMTDIMALARPILSPDIMNGNDAGKITFVSICLE